MSELSLIEKFRAGAPTHPAIIVGPGSDCAVLNWPASQDLLFKIDQVVEGTHFLLDGIERATPWQVGWKAMAKTCSDIAAAGGWPIAAMVALAVKRGSPEALAMGVYEGLTACCQKYGIGLAGGDFSTSESGLSVVVSLLGRCPKNDAWTRGGAKPLDVLYTTGSLGGSRASKKHLDFIPRLEEARQIRELIPGGVHACIDITDGLSRDLKHICDESACGATIRAETFANTVEGMQSALSDGEDFELLLAVDPAAAAALESGWKLETPLRTIGSIVEQEKGMWIVPLDGPQMRMPDTGYEHIL